MNKNKTEKTKLEKILKRASVSCGTTSCSLGEGLWRKKICIWRNNSYKISKFDENCKLIDPGILMDPKSKNHSIAYKAFYFKACLCIWLLPLFSFLKIYLRSYFFHIILYSWNAGYHFMLLQLSNNSEGQILCEAWSWPLPLSYYSTLHSWMCSPQCPPTICG